MPITKSSIQQLLIDGEIELALQDFRILAEHAAPRLGDELIHLSARYNSLQRDVNKGLLMPSDAKVMGNQITNAMIELLKKVPEGASAPGGDRAPQAPAAPPAPTPPPTTPPTAAGVKKILFLASNPSNMNQLRLGEEAREIEEGLLRAPHRGQYQLVTKWAVRTADVNRYFLSENPQIVHFSGHGSGANGLVFEDKDGLSKPVSTSALAGLFELFSDTIECVVLNACYSEEQANAIVQHIPYVVGMSQAVPDSTAVQFAVSFYDALAAGRGVEFAYKFARNGIDLESLSGSDIPQLKKKQGV